MGAKGQDTDTLENLPSEQQVVQDDTVEREILGDSPEVNKNGDTTRIRLGKKGITIVEKNGKTTVHIDKLENEQEENDEVESYDNEDKDFDYHDWDKGHKNKNKRFEGHFAGVELFLNNYMNSSNSMNLSVADNYMELNTSKSIGVRVNFIEYEIPLTNSMGFVTGMGMEFNSYYFSNQNNIQKENGQIVAKYKPAGSSDYEKTKLKDTYLNVPLLYEIQFPLGNSSKPLYMQFGVVGGIKIGSSTKEIYTLNGQEKKDKVNDDFYLNPFRYGLHAKVGFRHIHLFATYYPVPLFKSGKGPELYPFDAGLVLLNF